jgi:transketolase
VTFDVSDNIKRLRRQIVLATMATGEGHIPSAFSILDVLWVLYDKVLRCYPHAPQHEDRDRFVLSKGHGAIGLYAVLADKGFFPATELEGFATFQSLLGGHPDSNKVPGVEVSTGSLGHGFPMAVGIAAGLKIKKSARQVYCIVGDGESNEGTVWEAAMLASHHHLENLCCVIDFNHSTDRALQLGDLADKFKAFGWATQTIDGHDHAEILRAVTAKSDSPRAVIAQTIKGRGCKVMENNPAWHHRTPRAEELEDLLAQIS